MWDVFAEYLLKYWIGILTVVVYPAGKWINKKRKEYSDLTKRVEALEEKVSTMDDRVEKGFEGTNQKLDSIAEMLYQVKEDTAVNKAKLDK